MTAEVQASLMKMKVELDAMVEQEQNAKLAEEHSMNL